MLSALLALSCSAPVERTLLTQFFAASRLRDLTALSKVSTVVFEPAADGIVTSFDITGVAGDAALQQVSLSAPVRMPDGRTISKNFIVTIQRGIITAVTETSAFPSTRRP